MNDNTRVFAGADETFANLMVGGMFGLIDTVEKQDKQIANLTKTVKRNKFCLNLIVGIGAYYLMSKYAKRIAAKAEELAKEMEAKTTEG